MRIAFVDMGSLDYTTRTPLTHPLGGTESALCYLATHLAQLGHAVAVCNATTVSGTFDHVQFRNRNDAFALTLAQKADVAIVIGAADALALRRSGLTTPLVMWTGHLPDFATVQKLATVEEKQAWSAFAFVSEWQRLGYAARFGIEAERSVVMRNAIAPAFAQLEPTPAWFETGAAPLLVYTSTPFRGLTVLLHAFPRIRSVIGDVHLHVFSGMSSYQMADHPFEPIYRLARSTPGIEYFGPVSQPQLARQISIAAALAYPSIYAETSCIAALEAMRCGATVLTTRLGALPETVGSFGHYLDSTSDAREMVEGYAALVIQALTAMRADPNRSARERAEQIQFIQKHYTWPARAREWAAWLHTTFVR